MTLETTITIIGAALLILSFGGIILYSLTAIDPSVDSEGRSNKDIRHFYVAISQYFLLAISAFIVGAFFGLLFSIPSTDGSNSLSEIADWLTKLIIGASLVQARQIFGWTSARISQIANVVSGKITTLGDPKVFVGTTTIFFGVFGFLAIYLLFSLNVDSKQVEQGGADQPATTLESKPEGSQNPNPESDGRPQ